MTTEEEWSNRSVDLVIARVDFDYVVRAVDRYLELNPVKATQVVSIHQGGKPRARMSIASAVAAAATFADGQLVEMGFRIVNAWEEYESLVGRPRSYEHTMLVTHRNVYEAVAAKIIKDGTAELKATRPTKSKGTH